ncbi:MAG: hypothetical protein HC827_06315 [Cyanobacteria bacterium RM1_2_2]|nr:hypothetical protein [Cyanobacteria bacterium RM1_2_2]
MNIDQQLQILVQQAPQHGIQPDQMQMIVPVLKVLASRLQHAQYYILQTLDQEWVMTTLKHRTQAGISKTIVHAYPSLEAVKASVATSDLQIVALPLPVTQILFQLLAMEPIDSIIFYETSNPQQTGTEINRQMLRSAIEQHLQNQRSLMPPDIA